MKFSFKYALIAALIVGLVICLFVIIAGAVFGAWGIFCAAAAFEFAQAFVLGGLLDG